MEIGLRILKYGENHIIMKNRVLQREIVFVVMIIKEKSNKLLLFSKIPYLKQQIEGTTETIQTCGGKY